MLAGISKQKYLLKVNLATIAVRRKWRSRYIEFPRTHLGEGIGFKVLHTTHDQRRVSSLSSVYFQKNIYHMQQSQWKCVCYVHEYIGRHLLFRRFSPRADIKLRRKNDTQSINSSIATRTNTLNALGRCLPHRRKRRRRIF